MITINRPYHFYSREYMWIYYRLGLSRDWYHITWLNVRKKTWRVVRSEASHKLSWFFAHQSSRSKSAIWSTCNASKLKAVIERPKEERVIVRRAWIRRTADSSDSLSRLQRQLQNLHNHHNNSWSNYTANVSDEMVWTRSRRFLYLFYIFKIGIGKKWTLIKKTVQVTRKVFSNISISV